MSKYNFAMMPQSVWMQDLTWEEVAEYLTHDDLVLFPIGATEQHGPAGPLGVDSFVCNDLAEDAAQRTGTLCVPPLWYGDSTHHLAFPGTISLTTETEVAVCSDVYRSLARHGFRKIITINGNKSANLPGLLAATKTIHEFELPHVFFAVVDPMKLARGIATRIKGEVVEHHGGQLEISQVWYKHPSLIRQEKLGDTLLDHQAVFSKFFQIDLFGGGQDLIDIPWSSAEERAFAPTGQFSPNSGASPEMGRQYHEYMVDRLVEFIDWLRAYKGPIGNL
jgi:creatinine amidohydrolase